MFAYINQIASSKWDQYWILLIKEWTTLLLLEVAAIMARFSTVRSYFCLAKYSPDSNFDVKYWSSFSSLSSSSRFNLCALTITSHRWFSLYILIVRSSSSRFNKRSNSFPWLSLTSNYWCWGMELWIDYVLSSRWSAFSVRSILS